jgi:hypothetical protein
LFRNCEAYFQNAAYYALNAGIASKADIDIKSNLPCLLINVVGPYLGVCGAISTSRPTIQWLTPLVPLFPHTRDNESIVTISRLVKSIKILTSQLLDYYRNLDNNSIQGGFPFVQSISGINSEQISWTYIEPIFRHEQDRPIYKVRLNDERFAIAKFATRYCIEAHKLMSACQSTAELYGYLKLECGWYVIVMEYLETDKWMPLDTYTLPFIKKTEDDSQTVIKNIEQAIKILHGADYIHGDLRPNNIFVNPDTLKIKIVDWDWSGKINETHYPHSINPDILWPEGVSPGSLLRPSHDIDWIKALCESLKTK